jgi:Family of unknown function (DUF6461)
MPDGAAEVAAFSWVQDTVISEAACVTLVRSGDPAKVARALGGRLRQSRRASLAQAAEELGAEGDAVVAVRGVGSWVLAVEDNGWQGSRPEVLRRVSRGTRAVSTFWNVNGVTRFSYAASGQVVTAFEAMSPEQREGSDPDFLEEARSGLPWDTADWVALMLALAARLTGHPVEPAWLDGEFLVMPVEPAAEEVRPDINPRYDPLTYEDGPLAWALERSADDLLSAAARTAAQYVIRASGLDSRPAVAAALREGTALGPASSAALEQLERGFDRAARRSQGGDGIPAGRFWAVSALREAANPVPLAAAFRAINAASGCAQSLGLDAAALRAAVMGALGDPAPPSGSLGLTASPGPSPADRYEWITEHWLAPVGVITFVTGAGPEDLALAFGGDPAHAPTGVPVLTTESMAAIRPAGEWVVAVERGEPLAVFNRFPRLTADTTAVSISWSARGRIFLHYVVGGHVHVGLDPQRPERRDGDDPSAIDDYLAGLQLTIPGTDAAGHVPLLLAVAERLTGLRMTPDWLDQPHLLVPLPPWLPALRPSE